MLMISYTPAHEWLLYKSQEDRAMAIFITSRLGTQREMSPL